MKIKVFLTIGIDGASREEILEVPDEELEDMSDREKECYINDAYVELWVGKYLDFGYTEIKE